LFARLRTPDENPFSESAFIRLPVQFYLVGRSGPVNARDLYRVFYQHLPLWIAVAMVTWLARRAVLSSSPLIQLVVGSLAGGLAAVAVVAAFPILRREASFIIDRVWRFFQKPAASPA